MASAAGDSDVTIDAAFARQCRAERCSEGARTGNDFCDLGEGGNSTHLEPGGSAGELRAVQWDAPSFYLHNKGVYYHASTDTPDVVPASGLRTAAQAFARIFDEVNQLDLEDLRPGAPTTASRGGG